MRLRAGALLLIASLLGVVYPSVLFAAHTLDTSARFPNDATTTNNGNPVSTTYTCGSGTTVFVLGVTTLSGTNRAGGAPTYNGVTMTQANSTQKAVASPEASAEVWYLLAPPTGSSYTVSVPNTNTAGIKLQMASFKASSGNGSTLDTSNGCNGTSTNPTCSVTTGANGDAIFGVIASGANSYSSATQNQTSLWVMDLGTQGTSSQYALQSTLGTIAFSNTFGTSDDWGEVVVAFKELSYTVNLTGVQASGLKAPCTGGPGECVYVGSGASLSLDTKLATASTGTLDVTPVGWGVGLTTNLATASRGSITATTPDATASLSTLAATASRGTLAVSRSTVSTYFSISLKGTSTDMKTGTTPTITVTDGVGVISEAQTGNIGRGLTVTFDTNKVCYISNVNSSTSFDLVTNLGGRCENTSGAVTLNSIKYTFSSLSDMATNFSNVNGGYGFDISTATGSNTSPSFYIYNNPGGTNQETVAGGINFSTATWTSNKDKWFQILVAAGGSESIIDNRHRGVLNTTDYYSLTASTNYTLRFVVGQLRLRGLQLINSGTGGYAIFQTENQYTGPLRMYIEDNILVSTSNSGTGNIGIRLLSGSANGMYAHIRNNLIYSSQAQKLADGIKVESTWDNNYILAVNNTIHNAAYGIRNLDTTAYITAINNIISSPTANQACDGSLHANSGTNSTTDTDTGCGTGSFTSQTFSWASGSYMLDYNDTGALNDGANDPTSTFDASGQTFSDDFAGNARPTNDWDIGWHEVVTSTVSPETKLAVVNAGDISPALSGYFVSLTTVAATAERGTILVTGQRDESVSLTTVAGTGARGTLDVKGDASLSLTTVAGTGQRGDLTVTAGADATLVTKLATGERGTITVQSGADVPLTTVAGTGQHGDLNVTVDQTVPLTTVLATGERGTLDVSAGANVALTTVAGTGQRGDINPNVGTYVLLDTVAGTAQITSPTFSSSGDVTLATKLATGQRGTLTVTVDQTVPLTTVAGTGERGTLDVSSGASVALTTVNGTGQRGDLAVSGGASVDLTTVAGTGQRGDITATGESTADVNLTTVAGTGQRGTLTVTSGAQVDLTTVAGTSARGTLDVSAGATVALSTVLGTGQRGDLTVDWLVPSQNVDLTTQVATSSYGIISVYGGSSVALTGETATGQRGDLTTEGTSGATVALTTVAGTGERGTITPSWYRDGNALLAGTEAPSLTGDIAPSGDAAIGLTGEVVVAYANDIAVRRSSFRPWWPMPGGVVGTGGLVR